MGNFNKLKIETIQKSMIIAYILWFLLGWIGFHRFYSGKVLSGIFMFLLGGLGLLTQGIIIGWIFLVPILIVWVIDLFLVRLWIVEYNLAVIERFDNNYL